MATEMDTQQQTTTRSRSSSKRSSGLTLDLNDLPPLITPSPPSNTLLITNLNDPQIFHPTNLESIRSLISTQAPILSFSPLKSFRRIIVVFGDVDAAISLKAQLDGTSILGERIRVYFGHSTDLSDREKHLQAPKSDKLFFISPPPSPPHGWEMRNEEPPNKEVHAEDLAGALSKLHARAGPEPESPMSPERASGTMEGVTVTGASPKREGRSRSATIVYHPEDHGHSPDLPAIAVEDTSDLDADEEEQGSPMEGVERKMPKTERPPMDD